MDRAYLKLANGRVFEGYFFGARGKMTGEIVFTTAMTGYLETLTDPSYYGQIVVQTFPLIGNYGVIPSDFESDIPRLSAYIVREYCQEPSNFRSEGTLDDFLKSRGIIGMYGIDTRELTRIIRESGVMNARITDDIDDNEGLDTYKVRDAVKAVSCGEFKKFKCASPRFRVALWDFGAKGNIQRELMKRGCDIVVVPSTATADEIMALNVDGVMLSNGPGDPSENVEIIAQLKKLLNHNVPVFGICLGHQLMGLALGGKTVKLKYGHRGANQPVKDIKKGRVYITSQNHGYAVVGESLPASAEVRYINANDMTCEGIDYHSAPAFSVQFHPEASGGPLDTSFLFDRFINLMEGK